jgi:hypothetical protein
MSLFTDGLPAWWAMAVAVAALGVGVWLGELHGRGVGYRQAREDQKAERAARQVRSWREPSELLEMRPEDHAGMSLAEADEYWAGVERVRQAGHEAWLAHTEQALDLANDGRGVHLAPADDAFLAELHARLDNWLDENVYGGTS